MSLLRTLPTSRLIALLVAVAAVVGGGAAIATGGSAVRALVVRAQEEWAIARAAAEV